MSKHGKHRNPSKDASKPAAPSSPVQSQSIASSSNPTARRIVWQLVGVLGASVVLGFAFNASSPVGIRFNKGNSESLDSTALTTLSSAPPANQLTNSPPIPQPSAENLVATPATIGASPSTPTATPTLVPTRTLTPSSPAAPPLPAPTPAVVTSTTSPTDQNPAAIHWAQAKPLVDAGQAVLVDVRAKGMYDAGHIPSAISLPETSSPEEFTAFLNQHPTSITLILYCSSTSCSQSARVAGRLVTQFQRPSVKYMTGGYMEYQQLQASQPPATPSP